jgi:hypothetical protein
MRLSIMDAMSIASTKKNENIKVLLKLGMWQPVDKPAHPIESPQEAFLSHK